MTYHCKKCGALSPIYVAQCHACREWNTMRDVEKASEEMGHSAGENGTRSVPMRERLPKSVASTSVALEEVPRISGWPPADRVLGGGFVCGATYLLTGRPGIGKSTLSVQVGGAIADRGARTLIAATEETSPQIAERARRVETARDLLLLYPTTDLDELVSEIDTVKPALVIVDSVQYLTSKLVSSRAGSPAQMLAVGNVLKEKAKAEGFSVLFLGHIIKNGDAAGPKQLEHLVDATLSFDISAASAAALEEDEPVGDEIVRVFRSWKNRFGALASARFQMTAKGLVEVAREEDDA